MPERIQRKRTKGYRLPPNAVYVGRPSCWGNPFAVGARFSNRTWAHLRPTPLPATDRREPGEHVRMSAFMEPWTETIAVVRDRAHAVELYRVWVAYEWGPGYEEARHWLSGRDLACWCPLDQPCHADVLLEIAAGRPDGSTDA